MLIAIFVVLIVIMICVFCITLMVASITSDVAKIKQPKSYEQAQAELFKAWGDKICSKNET